MVMSYELARACTWAWYGFAKGVPRLLSAKTQKNARRKRRIVGIAGRCQFAKGVPRLYKHTNLREALRLARRAQRIAQRGYF